MPETINLPSPMVLAGVILSGLREPAKIPLPKEKRHLGVFDTRTGAEGPPLPCFASPGSDIGRAMFEFTIPWLLRNEFLTLLNSFRSSPGTFDFYLMGATFFCIWAEDGMDPNNFDLMQTDFHEVRVKFHVLTQTGEIQSTFEYDTGSGS